MKSRTRSCSNPSQSRRSVVSLGGRTDEWTYENFHGDTFGDTVYVTGSPVTSKILSNEFHDLVEVRREGFVEEKGAILPSTVAKAGREAREKYPNKRIIVHFMQPHIPFVHSPEVNFREWWTPYNDFEETDADSPRTIWGVLEMGLVGYDEVWSAYQENLRLSLDEVLGLPEDIPGKTVISSDHGNLMGERTWPIPVKLYGHPRDLRSRKLVTVPWAVLDDGRRERNNGPITGTRILLTSPVARHRLEDGLVLLGDCRPPEPLRVLLKPFDRRGLVTLLDSSCHVFRSERTERYESAVPILGFPLDANCWESRGTVF